MSGSRRFERSEAALRELAIAYPEAYEEFPWGERAFKVRRKVFLFLSLQDALRLTVKLPSSCDVAMMLPFAAPAGYGLGKSGWVTATFRGGEEVPIEMLREWIDESYRAVAPKRLAGRLPALE